MLGFHPLNKKDIGAPHRPVEQSSGGNDSLKSSLKYLVSKVSAIFFQALEGVGEFLGKADEIISGPPPANSRYR